MEYIEELKAEPDHEGIDFNILTYGIGEDLHSNGLEKLESIACHNDGIAYEIANVDDSLSTTMASYYQLFSLSRQIRNENDTWIVWVDYYDYGTGYLLFGACVPVYDKTSDPYGLLGIACVDVAGERFIDSNASTWGNSVGIYDDWETVYQELQETAKLCPILDNFDDDQLEVIRQSSQNAKSCQNNNNNNSGLSSQEITSIIIACVMVLIVIILCICLYQVRKYTSREKEGQMVEIAHAGAQQRGK